jgi:hypothetical protein
MKDLTTIFLVVGLSLVLLSNTHIVIQQANAKNNTSSLDTLNSNENIEKKLHSDIWSKNNKKY